MAKIGANLGSKVYPQACMITVLALEDNYSPIGLFFVNQKNPVVDYICTSDLIKVHMNASYGSFDVFSTQSRCTYITQGLIEVCNVDQTVVLQYMGYADLNTLVSIRYSRQSSETGTSTIEIIGNWQQVNNSMHALQYLPYLHQNTLRLRNYFYDPDATSGTNLPFETMDIIVQFSTPRDPSFHLYSWADGGGPWYQVGSILQLVHIVDIDDAPQIYNPTLLYTPAPSCIISQKGQLPPGWLSPTCNFGLYFTLEDSDITISISGLEISDVDVYETCTYSGQTFQECHNLMVLFKVFKGTMLLNSRTNLNFIEGVISDRDGFLFTATVSAISSAVKVIYYNVDLPQLIGTSSSTTLYYNTQNGGNTEYISVTVDDQGFTGWSGVLASTLSRINLTIVAVNQAPTVLFPAIVQYVVNSRSSYMYSYCLNCKKKSAPPLES